MYQSNIIPIFSFSSYHRLMNFLTNSQVLPDIKCRSHCILLHLPQCKMIPLHSLKFSGQYIYRMCLTLWVFRLLQQCSWGLHSSVMLHHTSLRDWCLMFQNSMVRLSSGIEMSKEEFRIGWTFQPLEDETTMLSCNIGHWSRSHMAPLPGRMEALCSTLWAIRRWSPGFQMMN
jgi:hypothetical protein